MIKLLTCHDMVSIVPVNIKSTRKRAVKPISTEKIIDKIIEKKTKLIKPNKNPVFEQFEIEIVDNVRKAIRHLQDYQESVHDTGDVTMIHKTNLVIKKIIRTSRWA